MHSKKIEKDDTYTRKLYEGKILHQASQARIIHFCELLLEHKLNPCTLNAFNDYTYTVDAANYTPLQALFKKCVKDDTKPDDFKLDGGDNTEEEHAKNLEILMKIKNAPLSIVDPLIVIMGIGEHDGDMDNLQSVIKDYDNIIDAILKYWKKYKVFYRFSSNKDIYTNNINDDGNNYAIKWILITLLKNQEKHVLKNTNLIIFLICIRQKRHHC